MLRIHEHVVSGRALARALAVLSLAVLLAPSSLLGGVAHAQEVQVTGPLAGQPAVRHMRQYRVDRVQLIVPTIGYTLQDEFSRSMLVGLEANFHFTDFLGIGIWGAAANFGNAFHIDTDLTSQIVENGQSTPRNRLSMPNEANFDDQVARLQGVITAHLLFAPLRGKLSLFQGIFVDTDFYILAGFALAFVEERANVETPGVCATDSDECRATQTARQNRFAPTVSLGVGLNLYFNEWIGMAIQWRAFPFAMNPMGTDEGGGTGDSSVSIPDGLITDADQRFYFHHMMNIGLIINLPPEIRTTR
jgi:outer membrane beta-barrel protein